MFCIQKVTHFLNGCTLYFVVTEKSGGDCSVPTSGAGPADEVVL
ncbi:hypothetical protein [Mesobacillus foraminis]|nr:hypothetical protein [Mesobacillus foraminis]